MGLLWSVLVLAGFVALWSYGATPGDNGQPPHSWPTGARAVPRGRYTLLLFAHPFCPCTRATFSELARLLADCHDRIDTHAFFIAPEGADPAWHDSDLYELARQIPGARVHIDANRLEAELFRVRTSGGCLLYAPDGTLVFNGGLTDARGHEGDNDGPRAIRDFVMGKQSDISRTPVFGCPLFESNNVNDQARPLPN